MRATTASICSSGVELSIVLGRRRYIRYGRQNRYVIKNAALHPRKAAFSRQNAKQLFIVRHARKLLAQCVGKKDATADSDTHNDAEHEHHLKRTSDLV